MVLVCPCYSGTGQVEQLTFYLCSDLTRKFNKVKIRNTSEQYFNENKSGVYILHKIFSPKEGEKCSQYSLFLTPPPPLAEDLMKNIHP